MILEAKVGKEIRTRVVLWLYLNVFVVFVLHPAVVPLFSSSEKGDCSTLFLHGFSFGMERNECDAAQGNVHLST